MVDVVVAKYAPLPAPTLGQLVTRLGAAAPQWRDALVAALARAKRRLPARASMASTGMARRREPGIDAAAADDRVCLLAPFDPVVWDRCRFERFWGWPYRFEAYTPAPKRKLGYYALPLLWRERVVGWVNVTVRAGRLAPRSASSGRASSSRRSSRRWTTSCTRMNHFLGLGAA